MKRFATTCLAVAASVSLVGAGALAASADGATKPPERDQTFQMFADVSASGGIGASHDVVVAGLDTATYIYTVKFTHKISHCAAAATPGRSSGKQGVTKSGVIVAESDSNTYIVRFNDIQGSNVFEPFMLTVTCNT